MKSRIVSMAFLLCWAPLPANAQVPEPQVLRWTQGQDNSKEFYLSGRRLRALDAGKVLVVAAVESTDDPLKIYVHFSNRGEAPFDVLPETVSLVVAKPVSKALAYISPDKIAKDIESMAAWAIIAESLAGAARAFSGTSTTTTSATATAWTSTGSSAYGTYNGVTRTYDSAANQQMTNQNVANIVNVAEAEKVRNLTGAVLANTVFSGQEFGGILHFKRDKKATELLLRVPVAGLVLELPLEPPKR